MKLLLEASGSLTSAYLIENAQKAGFEVYASDIIKDCFAVALAKHFVIMPKTNDLLLWEKTTEIIVENNIKVILPSLDETLIQWAKRKSFFEEKGCTVVISDAEVLEICQDKWLTYLFFIKNGIPTPKSSLQNEYNVLKPRLGRGGAGIIFNADKVQNIEMEGMISQEFVAGEEYTIDVFCDFNNQPIYIIPRKRINVKDGKSIEGITVYDEGIINWVKKICAATNFIGPINIQCFKNESEIIFIEINPRVAGGMALGFAASENWFELIKTNLLEKNNILPKNINWNLKMKRYYAEVFIP